MKTVWLVAIFHGGPTWPQVLSCHETFEAASEAASRDGYRADSLGSTSFNHPNDYHPMRIIICMEVQSR